MSGDEVTGIGRRYFLKGVVVAAGTMQLAREMITTAEASSVVEKTVVHPEDAKAGRLEEEAAGYESLGPDEIEFVEALVNVMCPADDLTPNGVECGVATFIDRQLAGGYGTGERLYMRGPWKQGNPQQGYQLPLTPQQYFKAGIAAIDEAARKARGKKLSEMMPAEADTFLNDIAAGKVDSSRISLASWFNELVYPLFIQGCFADPIYGGNKNKVFWKMIGYPGLPATHTRDMVQYRGKPYPDAQHPKAITDFS